MKLKTQLGGFTLIELLVVIAIIGLLSTLAVVSLNNARQKSRDAKRVSDIKQIQTALELFYADKNGYPGGAAVVLGSAGFKTMSSTNIWSDTAAGTTYMGQVPVNPTPGGSNYSYTGKDSAGAGCALLAAPFCADYALTFTTEGAVGQLTAKMHVASPNGIQD